MREPEMHRAALYASVGRELSHYNVDSQSATLVRRLPLMLPCKVQYVWPHPAAPYLYAACSDGYGFGPRHLDFHPSQPWVYVSLERQNTLHMYRGWGDTLEAAPSYVKGTLADPAGARRRQRSGTVHLHPNGRCAYVANRASGTATVDGNPVFIGGENNIAVYAIDPHSGEPAIIQHADTHGIVPRTFALDPAGRLLVAANSVPILSPQGTGMTTIPPSLAVFRVGHDGKLGYVRKYDIDVGAESLFWMGIVALN